MSERFFYVSGQVDYNFDQIRDARNECLQLTDFIMITDSPLSPDKIDELKAYRQSLRDITEYESADEAAENFPTHPTWLVNWVIMPE